MNAYCKRLLRWYYLIVKKSDTDLEFDLNFILIILSYTTYYILHTTYYILQQIAMLINLETKGTKNGK